MEPNTVSAPADILSTKKEESSANNKPLTSKEQQESTKKTDEPNANNNNNTTISSNTPILHVPATTLSTSVYSSMDTVYEVRGAPAKEGAYALYRIANTLILKGNLSYIQGYLENDPERKNHTQLLKKLEECLNILDWKS